VNLFNLQLGYVGVNDMDLLSGLTNMRELTVIGNGLTEISFVSGMTQLTVLNAAENQIADFSPVAGLNTLVNLNIAQNLVDNLQAVAGLYNLDALQTYANRISDLSPLSALTHLSYLGLVGNQIFTVTPLIANPGIGAGDQVELNDNPLGPRALCTDIPLLEARGATVTRDIDCGDVGVSAPVITSDGGNGPGANFLTNQPAFVLEGTCDEYAVEVRVNGSAAGVLHTPHATTWSLSTTLLEGVQTFTVQALDDSGAESPTDSITITLDATRPRVVSASALGASLVQVIFSEEMTFDLDLQNPAFYTFNGSGVGLAAAAVVRISTTTVNITVNAMTNGGHYTVYAATASPTDIAGNHVDPAANSANFVGVNPSDADSDSDGLPDSWELAHDLDINTPSASDDPDEDGLTNLEEFNAGSDPQNDADPPGDVYVATTGTDDPAGGSQAAPWRTIGFAMLQVARFATAAHRVTVHVAAGIYEEKVAFAPHTSLVGDAAGDPAASIIRFFNAGESEHVVMTAASDTALRNCTVTLPAAVSATAELLRVTNVIIEVEDAVLDGAFSPNALGVFITGPGSSASVVRNCTIRRLNYGVWASDSGVNITRNTFDDIFEDAISIRRPVGKQVGETPLLGDAGQLETSGFNQFGSVEDTFVRNNNPAETRAEFNDWGLYQREQIAGRIADDIGPVDFEPFLGKSILPGTLVVAVLDAATETPIPGSAHPAASTGAIDGEYDTTSGLHFFATLDPAAYTIEVAADGYVAENREVTVVAGDITAATFYLAGAGEITLRAAAQDLTDSFSAADTDDDGRLSFTEARAQVPALTQAQFDQIDTSNDGLLAQAELEAVLEVDDGGLFNCRRTLRSLGIKGAFGNLFLAGLAFVCLQAGRRNRTS
ncbi:MAG: DUF1565 domain-containing protein, partial [Candidatus Hydrogenedentes bacterium]|nr:DUF1565 domain-containing protein [Candidatus Hydrogenedentota bacterium]